MGRRIRTEDDARAHGTAVGERTCASCGRRMPVGAAAEARWCSAACRRHRIDDVDRALERAIAERLDAGVTEVDPAEVARTVGGSSTGTDPDPLREAARRAARRLTARGAAEVVQHGTVVDASTARGPFRVRRPR